MKKHSSFPKLLKSFGSDNLYQFGRSLYKAIECGPWTTAVLRDGSEVYYEDTPPVGFDPLNVTALMIGSIVEGSDVEVGPIALTFPFSEEEFNDAVESINDEAKFHWYRDNSEFAWHLFRFDEGVETLVDVFVTCEGQDVMGCDMHAWMMENGHYGDVDPDNYEWDGDTNSVAIMSKKEGHPDFRFDWITVA